MENVKGHWKKFRNPDYLGSWDFEKGEVKTATITNVAKELVLEPKTNKKEECLLVYFDSNLKPLILNATNSKAISRLAKSNYVEDWIGTKIALNVEKVKAFGDIHDAVRIMKTVPKPALKYYCNECGAEIKPIQTKDGLITAEEYAVRSKKKNGKIICTECFNKENK